jgi:hypothetical protein
MGTHSWGAPGKVGKKKALLLFRRSHLSRGGFGLLRMGAVCRNRGVRSVPAVTYVHNTEGHHPRAEVCPGLSPTELR